MELILTDKAYRSIQNECKGVTGVETGGLLVGKRISDRFLVAPFALGSGPKASRSISRYSPDIEWQQQRLDRLFIRFGLGYIGSYHMHPGDMDQPSWHDLLTANKIVTDPEWNVTEAVFPIINLIDEQFLFHPYYISRRERHFQPITWHLVSHRDTAIRDLLKGVKR